jgi:hypothetical protein
MLILIHSKLLFIIINKNPIMNLHYSIIRIYPNLKKYIMKDINDFINNEDL